MNVTGKPVLFTCWFWFGNSHDNRCLLTLLFSFECVLNHTEKFSEMKDEIPQAVIDTHVKNAANARAEKVKQETSEENAGVVNKYKSGEALFLQGKEGN